MAQFSFHCECYKAASVGGLDKHNRRLNKHYGNKDINKDKTDNNRIYIAPQQSLYKDCKDHIERRVVQNGGDCPKTLRLDSDDRQSGIIQWRLLETLFRLI